MSRALLLAAPLGFLLLLSCQKYAPREVPQSVVADARSAFSVVADLPLWTLAQGLLTPKESIPLERSSLSWANGESHPVRKERDSSGAAACRAARDGCGPTMSFPASILGRCDHRRCRDLHGAAQHGRHHVERPPHDGPRHPRRHRRHDLHQGHGVRPGSKAPPQGSLPEERRGLLQAGRRAGGNPPAACRGIEESRSSSRHS